MGQVSRIRLGTRGSALARWQADWVSAQLRSHGVDVELILITTQGDVRTGPIGALGTQGVFTKEIQRALLDERIDLAVHSLKDLPTEPVEGLVLAAVPPRERPGDVLVSREAADFDRCRRGRASAPAARGDEPSCCMRVPTCRCSIFAATWTRRCDCWMKGSTTRWCWPKRDSFV